MLLSAFTNYRAEFVPTATAENKRLTLGKTDTLRRHFSHTNTHVPEQSQAAEREFVIPPSVSDAVLYVVDDDDQVRTSLRQLAHSVCLNVRGFASAQEFLESYRSNQPGCLVLDVCLPGMSGVELLEHLRGMGCEIPTIIITAYGEVPIAVRTMKAGVLSFIEKPFGRQEMLSQIQRAISHLAANSEDDRRREEVLTRLATLSSREREIMQMFFSGENTKKIASRLDISPKTVDYHRWNLLKKMNAQSMVELAHYVTKYTR